MPFWGLIDIKLIQQNLLQEMWINIKRSLKFESALWYYFYIILFKEFKNQKNNKGWNWLKF